MNCALSPQHNPTISQSESFSHKALWRAAGDAGKNPVFKGLAHQIGSKVLTFPSGGLVILRFKNMLYEKELEGVKERRKLHFGKWEQRGRWYCWATEKQEGLNYHNLKRRKDGLWYLRVNHLGHHHHWSCSVFLSGWKQLNIESWEVEGSRGKVVYKEWINSKLLL